MSLVYDFRHGNTLSFKPQHRVVRHNILRRRCSRGRRRQLVEDAYTDLQDGIDAAGAGDEVWVKEGTYQGFVFVLKSNVDVYGGFDQDLGGTGGSVGQRVFKKDVSIIDGAGIRAAIVQRQVLFPVSVN